MIECTKAWKVGEEFFPTLEGAQRAEIQALFVNASTDQSYSPETAADVVFDNKIALIAILTGTKPRRRRSDAGKPHAKPVIKRKAAIITDPPTEDGVTVEASSKYKGK